MRILLLNPPSRPPVLRDMSCGETAKASYYWAPIDLLVLSARLSPGHEIGVLDATAERLTADEALSRAAGFAPDTVVSLIAAVSLDPDREFLRSLKTATGAEVAVLGDIASFAPGMAILEGAVDAAIPDFTDEALMSFFEGNPAPSRAIVRSSGEALPHAPSPGAEMSYGVPRHELFPLRRYSMPYSLHRPVATLMQSYGCPYRCSFCASGKLRYRPRNLGDFLAEYDYVASLGIREFFLRDLTFGVDRARALDFCGALAKRRKMVWSCEARLDTVDPELLGGMKKAGCHLVMLGVETASRGILASTAKGYTDRAQAAEVFRAARKAGLSSLAHFILGFPEDTAASMEETLEFASGLDCEMASFNLLVPSDLRASMVSRGDIPESDLCSLDCTTGGRSLCALSVESLEGMRRRAMRRFYLRPSRLLRLLGRSMTPAGLANLAGNGLRVLRRSQGS
jgi:anaerobic magnesium-protoporphyrin IX monomethyl ester cyclase